MRCIKYKPRLGENDPFGTNTLAYYTPKEFTKKFLTLDNVEFSGFSVANITVTFLIQVVVINTIKDLHIGRNFVGYK